MIYGKPYPLNDACQFCGTTKQERDEMEIKGPCNESCEEYVFNIGGAALLAFILLLTVGSCDMLIIADRYFDLERTKAELAPMLPATVEEEK